MTIAVVDYGMGNIGSISNMLKYIGADHIVSSDHHAIAACDKIVLPGVGHFDLAMQNLEQRDLVPPAARSSDRPRDADPGHLPGDAANVFAKRGGRPVRPELCRCAGTALPPPDQTGLKVPHMGWSEVLFARGDGRSERLSHGLEERARFYFVHGYRVTCDDPDDIWGTTDYGGTFVSAFVRRNIVGVQFHPEKSHRYGIQLFRNFVDGFTG